MKRLALLVGLFLLAEVTNFTTAGAYYLDTPHNESNGIYCYTCHSMSYWRTPPPSGGWGGDVTIRNAICLQCHGEDSIDPHQGPAKKLHASSTTSTAKGTWSTECTQCHDVHSQGQLDWAATDADNLYLAWGTLISGGSYLEYDYDDSPDYGSTSFTISGVAGQPGWADTASWVAKGGKIDQSRAIDGSRGLIFVPDKLNPDESYEIIAASPTSVKIKGKITTSGLAGKTFGVIYGQSLKSYLMPNGGKSVRDYRDVKFFKPEVIADNVGGYIDESGSAKPKGLCQVCHDRTAFWKNDGSHTDHNSKTNCGECHDIFTGLAGGADHSVFIGDLLVPGCGNCHLKHIVAPESGHSGGCNTCHGYPKPTINSNTMASEGGIQVRTALSDGDYNFVDARLTDRNSKVISDPDFVVVDCGECHALKRAAVQAGGNHGHAATSFGWNSTCVDCHGPETREVVKDVHDKTCNTCHAPGNYAVRITGSITYGIDGTAVGATRLSKCTDCHKSNIGVVHHDSEHGLAADSCTTSCHATSANHKGNHTTLVAGYGNCDYCHAANIGGDKYVGAPIDAADTVAGRKIHDNCNTCHNTTTNLKTWGEVNSPLVIAMPNPPGASNDGGGNCLSCHGEYFTSHSHANHLTRVAGTTACNSCHPGTAGTLTSVPTSLVDPKLHDDCHTCHQTTGVLVATSSKAPGIAAGGGNCTICHGSYFPSHKINHATRVAGTTNCTGCHTATAGLSGDIPVNATDNKVHDACSTCHAADTNMLRGAYGKASAMPTAGDCNGCHGAYFVSHINANHTSKVAMNNGCSGSSCHSGTQGTSTGVPVSPLNNMIHDACTTCHSASDGALVGLAEGHVGGGNCLTCHLAGHDTDQAHNHRVTTGLAIDCASCHAAGSAAAVDALHSGCQTCHGYNGTRLSQATVSAVIAAGRGASGSDQNCERCHTGIVADHAAAHTNVHVDKPACLRCHTDNVVEEHVGKRGFSCSVCHASGITAVIDTIAAGEAGTNVTCESCHHSQEIVPSGIGKYQDGHHATVQSTSGNCTFCHVVGAGSRAVAAMPCLKCHGSGKLADPQRAGVSGHANGPALTKTQDGRVCFSCHLAAGAGYKTGTPLVTPLHALPANSVILGTPLKDPTLSNPGREKVSLRYLQWHETMYDKYYHVYTVPKNTPNWTGEAVDPYVMVPHVSGSNTNFVPSFSTGGPRGKAAGSGSLTVAIAAVAENGIDPMAIPAEAQWREDGKEWQTGGTTKSGLDPRQHLVEGRMVAGWATSPAVSVEVVATATASATVTYQPCPADASIAITRTSGETSGAISWSSETQREEFVVSGNTPSAWDVEWVLDSGNATGFTVVSTGRQSCRIEKNGTTLAGTYDFILKATGSSCPGNIATVAMTVTVTGAGVNSPVAPSYYGVIQDTPVDTLTDTVYPRLLRLHGNTFGSVYYDGLSPYKVKMKTFTVEDNGAISDSFNPVINLRDSFNGAGPLDVIRLTDTTIAVARYTNWNNVVLDTFVTGDGGVTYTPVNSLVLDAAASGTSNTSSGLKIQHLSGDVYAVIIPYNSLKTVAITGAGVITAIDVWKPIFSGIKGGIQHVAGDIYAALCNDGSWKLTTFRIAANGTITKTAIDSFAFNGSQDVGSFTDGTFAHLFGNIYAVAYTMRIYADQSGGTYVYPDTLITLAIDDTGAITKQVLNSFPPPKVAPGTISTWGDMLAVTDNVLAVAFGNKLTTYDITNAGWIAPVPIDSLTGLNSSVIHVAGDIYLSSFYTGGLKTFKINTESPTNLAASLAATPGSVCNAVDVAVTVNPSGTEQPPYVCDFTWGDGSAAETGVPCTRTHVYPAGTETTANVTWAVRDSSGHTLQYPNPRTDIIAMNRDIDGDAVCVGDPCPNEAPDDADADGVCAGSGFLAPMLGDHDPCPSEAPNDADGDGYCAGSGFLAPMLGDHDNSPAIYNPLQEDSDHDGIGDVSDACPEDPINDPDSDQICAGATFLAPNTAGLDNCPAMANPLQEDNDLDGVGNICDNCPNAGNPLQEDIDGDGIGDVCDGANIYAEITVTDAVIPTNDLALPFGDTVDELTIEKTVTVTNEVTATANLAIGAIGAANPLAAPFTILADTCSGQSLAPGLNCTFTVRFAPAALGTFSDSFDIPSSDHNENPVTITVSGRKKPAQYAYIAYWNGIVSAIRTFDDTLIKTVRYHTDPAGNGIGNGIAVAPDGAKVYFANFRDGGGYSVLNTADDSYSPVSSGGRMGAALSPNGVYLYITKYSEKQVEVFRTSDNVSIATVNLGSVSSPTAIAASPDGARIYVALTAASGQVAVIRTSDYSVINTVNVGSNPYAVAVSPDSRYVYVSNSGSSSVSVIRAADLVVESPITVGSSPYGLDVTPDGSYLYVANMGSNSVSAVRLVDKMVTNIGGVTAARGVSITPDGSKVYISTYSVADRSARVISTASKSVIKTISVASGTESREAFAIGRFIASVDPAQSVPNISVTDTFGTEDDLGLDFGSIYEGYTSGKKTVTITNTGHANLVLGTLGAGHPLGVNFAKSNDTCSGQTLTPEESCTFGLWFTPTVTGVTSKLYDSIDIPSNDPDQNPTTFSVSGLSTVSEISVTDELAPVDDLIMPFGDRVQGTVLSRQITVTNSGNGNLKLGAIGNGDSLAAPFSMADDTCSSNDLVPNESCTFSVVFSPVAVGSFTDTFAIPSNDPDENSVTMTVTGTGTPTGPDITVTDIYSATSLAQTAIDFGHFDVHAAYLDKSIYVRNDGTAALNIASVSFATDPRSFSIVSDYCTGNLLPSTWPNNICSVVVRFDPTTTAAETFNATLQVASTDPDEKLVEVALGGSGYQSQHAFITNNYTFPGGTCGNTYDNCANSYSITPISISYNTAGALTNTASANIYSYSYPPSGVAATPAYAFVTIPTLNRVNVYPTAGGGAVATVSVGTSPQGVAASPDGKYVYAANYSSGTVSVFNQKSPFNVVTTVAVGAGPTGIDVSPDSAFIYVSNYSAHTVSVIAAASNTVVATIPVGNYPYGLAVSPDGAGVYVVNSSSNTVSVIQTSTNTVVSTIPGFSYPHGVAFTPDGKYAYVSNSSAAKVSVIRTVNNIDNTVVATVTGISSPYGVAATADGKYIYVAANVTYTSAADPVGGKVYIIKTSDNSLLTSIPTGKGSIAMGRFITAGFYDRDGDGVGDTNDNCPTVANPDQADSDADGIGNSCDNCQLNSNLDQLDSDCDGAGDVCGLSVYIPPAGLGVTQLQFASEAAVAWDYVKIGENGYRLERKDEACSANTMGFLPVAALYNHDDFATRIDPLAWSQGAYVQTANSTGAPATIADSSGSASVGWADGAATLHTSSLYKGDGGYNYSNIAIKNVGSVVDSKDFDMQVDFTLPNGESAATLYQVYARLEVYFPTTTGSNFMKIERVNGAINAVQRVGGVKENGSYATTAATNTVRLVRSGRKLSGYVWNGSAWQLLHTHSLPLDSDLVPTWAGISQWANRNEPAGQNITARIDNFRFNTVGGMPTPKLDLAMDESLWQGTAGEVFDNAIDGNHATAFGGVSTVVDLERGRVGSFDGIDDYIAIPRNGTLQNVISNSFSFAAWVKPADVPPSLDPLPADGGHASDWLYTVVASAYPPDALLYNNAKQFQFRVFNTDWAQPSVISPQQYAPGAWHHVVGVANDTAKTLTLYVDGEEAINGTYSGTLMNPAGAAFHIGNSNPGGDWDFRMKGNVDDAQIFDHALSAAEVAALHAQSMEFKDTGLTKGTEYCYRAYPFKTDSCPNWGNHEAFASFTTTGNILPDQPVNVSPAAGATDLYARTPTLTASAFSDSDPGDTMYGSHWLVSTGSGAGFDSGIVYQSGGVGSSLSHGVTTTLATNTTYYWRVRYQDSKGEWSSDSAETSFVITNTAPTAPTNAIPAAGATGVAATPTMTASAFVDSDAGAGDIHAASQWLISTGSGAAFDANLIYDSGVAAATTSHTVVGSGTFGTTYYWKVRYRDSRADWSPYSAETSFTIVANVAPNQPVNTTPANGATWVARRPQLTASAFTDGDGADTHQASQWQVSTGSGAAFDAGVVYDSSGVAGATNHTVATTLAVSTPHYWRVRYQDSKGVWSAYSAESSFTTTSLVTGYHLSETTGTAVADFSGNNTGTISNGGTNAWGAGFAGNGLVCDGNDRITFGYAEGRLKNNFSLEAMVKTSVNHDVEVESNSITGVTGGTAGQKYVFGANIYGGTDSGMGVSVGTGGISVYEHSGGYMPPLAVYSGSLGTGWNHIVVTYTDKQPRIYLNGNLVRTGLTSLRTNVWISDSVCSDTSGPPAYGPFSGSVDEVKIYGAPLSDTEVLGRCVAVGQCPP